MKIEYELQLADLDAASKEYLRQPHVIWRNRRQSFLIGLAAGGLVFFVCYAQTELDGSIAAAVFCFLVVWTIVSAYLSYELIQNTRKMWTGGGKLALGLRTLEVTTEGVSETFGTEVRFVRWEEISSVQPTDTHLFIWLKSGSLLVVSHRNFESPAYQRVFARHISRVCPPTVWKSPLLDE